MKRLPLILVGLVLAGLVLATGGDRPKPSAVALANGWPAGPYSEAEFEVSDDAVDMVLAIEHAGRALKVWGDGRAEIQAGEGESYTRQLGRSRLLEIFGLAVDNGLAEFSLNLLVLEIGRDAAFRKPCKTPRVSVTLRFTAYDRRGATGGIEREGICPDDYPQIVQSRGFVELRAVLDYEIGEARREGSIEIPTPDYKAATFTLSSDPAQLVLRFGFAITGSVEMSLYGDGRLVLTVKDHRGEPERYDRQLTFLEASGLVRLAVEHGFAEWDPDSLSHLAGKRSSHPSVAYGELNLESYRRGEYGSENLTRSFRFGDARHSLKYFADVLQVEGLRAMRQALNDHLESAKGGR
ncbi:MAG: hypothetical protein AAF657_25270 [Acidobacteriota bacterium]